MSRRFSHNVDAPKALLTHRIVLFPDKTGATVRAASAKARSWRFLKAANAGRGDQRSSTKSLPPPLGYSRTHTDRGACAAQRGCRGDPRGIYPPNRSTRSHPARSSNSCRASMTTACPRMAPCAYGATPWRGRGPPVIRHSLDARTLSVTNNRVSAGGRSVENDPKSAMSRRQLPLPNRLVGVLHDARERQRVERKLAGSAYRSGAYVVSNEIAIPIPPPCYPATGAMLSPGVECDT